MRKKRTLVQKGRKGLSIRKQCKLLGVSINAIYYKPKGERPENEEAMKKMDRFFSMDGRGRAKDNIWIERFWRTIKREYIYLNPCDNAIELRKGIEKFMQYYNTERHHQGIDNEIPQRKYENNKLLIRTHEAA